MYKSMLLELCQQNSWSLPKYSCCKDGLDHTPFFQASVIVNGVSFDTHDFLWRSSKGALNDAAQLAFDHFNPSKPLLLSQSPVRVASSPSSHGSSSASAEFNNTPSGRGTLLPENEEVSKSSPIHKNSSGVKDDKEFGDMQYLYKNQLQSFVQRRNLDQPLYSCIHEGPPHALRFKAKVVVDGQTFESPEFFHKLREAEYAAAKAALMSLSQDGVKEEVSCLYKNLLQELTLKEGFSLPVYNTVISVASHLPAFLSTVEVEGEIFHGIDAKTKKKAEMNAAKVAYSSLKERRLSRSCASLFESCQAQEAPECASSSSQLVITVEMQQNLRSRSPLISTPSIGSEELGAQGRDNAEVSVHHSTMSLTQLDTDATRNKESADMIYARLRDPFPSVPSSLDYGALSSKTASECSDYSVMDSNTKLPMEMSSLSCN